MLSFFAIICINLCKENDNKGTGGDYEKEMIWLALQYAFDILRAEKVTIGVFENNMPAYHCYKAAGFMDVEMAEKEMCEVCGETWNVLELEMEKKHFKAVRL